MNEIIFVIQGSYLGRWEDVDQHDNERDARESLRIYRDNEPQFPHRLRRRKVRP